MVNNRLFFISLTIFLVITSCNRIVNNEEDYPYYEEREGVVSLNLSSDQSNRTKSLYTESDMGNLNSVVIYGVDEVTGHWKRAYVTASAGSASTTMSFTVGHALTFYVLGNIPNDQAVFSVDSQGRLLPEDFVYMLPTSTNELKVTGIPMAKKVSVSANEFSSGNLVNGNSSWGVSKVGEYPLDVKLERLMAKVVVEIDKSDITGGQDEPVLASDHIAVRQANRRMRPFHPGGSKALYSSDIFAGSYIDYENLSDNVDMIQSGIVLYVPENRQGEITGSDWSTDSPSDLNGQGSLCTYIEYIGYKDGIDDGVDGDVYYRGFLGGSSLDHDNFSIERNKSYTASLSLTWNGLVWNADGGWRINTDDVTDTRHLVFLDEDGVETDYLEVQRNGSAEVFAYFAIGDDTAGITGRKDEDSYPYGWNLLFNNTQLSGHDGSSGQYNVATGVSVRCLGNAVVDGKNTTRLRVSATTAASTTTLLTRHRMSLRTVDGKVNAATLYIDIKDVSFLFEWVNDKPNHVGQRGTIRCIDPYTDELADNVQFSLASGYSSYCRLTDNGDGTAEVELLRPFSSVSRLITATDPGDNRSSSMAMEARLPYFESTDLWTTFVDAHSSIRFTYKACNSNGTESDETLEVKSSSDAGYTGNGNQLDKALVEANLPISLSCSNNKIGFTKELMGDGSYIIYAYIKNYSFLNPQGNSFTVDQVQIGMSGRSSNSTTFTAWNPWKNITTVPEGNVLDDYTLYEYPDQMEGGWLPSAPGRPSMDKSYTMQIQNAVIANQAHIQFNAIPQEGESGYLGSICTGSPLKTAYDFADNKYTLIMTVILPSGYDIQTPAIANSLNSMRTYLNGKGFSFQSIYDLNKFLIDNNYEIVVSNNFNSSAEALAARPTTTIPYTAFSYAGNTAYKTWTMTYSMKGKTDANMNGQHGAGPVDIVYEIKNPNGSGYLRRQIATIYMRLHAYYYPMVIEPDEADLETYTKDDVEFGIMARDGGLYYLREGGCLEDAIEVVPFSLNLYNVDEHYGESFDFRMERFTTGGMNYTYIHPSGVSTFFMKNHDNTTQYKYFSYHDSLTDDVGSIYSADYIPLRWTTEYEGPGHSTPIGWFKRTDPLNAYFDPSGLKDNGSSYWDPNNANEDGCLIYLHIIPVWYYTYPLQ